MGLMTVIAILILLFIIYLSAPLYLPFIENKINKINKKFDYRASKDARDFHSTLFIIDLHADSLFSCRSLLQSNSRCHVDIPRLIKGNVKLQVFATPTLIPFNPNIERNTKKFAISGFLAFMMHWPINTWYSKKNRALYQSNKLHQLQIKSKNTFEIIKTSNQLENYFKRCRAETNITAGLLALEGAYLIDNIPGDIDELYNQGFRIIGLTHLTDSNLGGSAHGVEKGGLTESGRKAIKRIEELNMIIDLAHASPKLIEDVLRICSRPVIVSHTGVKGCIDNNRNLSDQQIKEIADKGGLIGVGFWETAVGKNGVESIVNCIKYLSDLVGVEHVTLGSDFDGAVTIPFDATGLVHITEELIKQGFSEKNIRMIMGENALNFLLNALPKEFN